MQKRNQLNSCWISNSGTHSLCSNKSFCATTVSDWPKRLNWWGISSDQKRAFNCDFGCLLPKVGELQTTEDSQSVSHLNNMVQWYTEPDDHLAPKKKKMAHRCWSLIVQLVVLNNRVWAVDLIAPRSGGCSFIIWGSHCVFIRGLIFVQENGSGWDFEP